MTTKKQEEWIKDTLLTILPDIYTVYSKEEDKRILDKAKIVNDAFSYNKSLISSLLKNSKIQANFFEKIEVKSQIRTYLFKQAEFIEYIEGFKYLNDSATKFANKIGLADRNKKYLKQTDQVVLNFPFKDCVLEGGQTADDQKGKELFFNSIIEKEEINKLLYPKALSKVKKYTCQANGLQANSSQHKQTSKQQTSTTNENSNEEVLPQELTQDAISSQQSLNYEAIAKEVTKFNRNEEGIITDNLVIKGNNLLALHSLKAEFYGKIKLIYIDPPYNTGNDSFKYNDRFNHSTWLTFMKNRLEVAKQLLKDDGVIFIQIDDNEQAYLKVLMDEVFGRENFVTTLHVEMSTTQGMKVGSAKKGNIVKNCEYIIIFAKNGQKDIVKNIMYDIRNFDNHYSYFFDGTMYAKLKEILLQNKAIADELELLGIKNKTIQDIYNMSPSAKEFILDNANFIVRHHSCDIKIPINIKNKINKQYPIEYKADQKEYLLIMQSNNNVSQLIPLGISLKNANDFNNTYGLTKIRGDLWKDYYLDMGNISKEGKVEFESGKKAERLVKDLIHMVTQEGDIVLDFHAGSGTTGAVAHKMGRQYILVEQMDYIENITVERLKKVICGEQGGISKAVNWQGGGEFIYLELAKFNQQYIDDIINSKTIKDLQRVWRDMLSNSLLHYKFNIEPLQNKTNRHLKEKATINEKEAVKILETLNIEEDSETFKQVQQLLIDSLNKNMLYIPSNFATFKEYKLTDNDINLTKDFYKQNT